MSMMTDSAAGKKVDEKKLKELDTKSDAFVNAQRGHIGGRRLCITQEGYIGMAPFASRVGDIVCIFSGGSVPFVLLEQEENYMLVGESYVHGLMDGQVLRRKGFESQDILLI